MTIINNNVNGILVKKNDEKSLIEAIKKVLNDEEFCKSISKKALELRKTLNYENIYSQWESYVKKIVEKNAEE